MIELLAAEGGRGGGYVGLLIIAVLLITTFLLVRNMTKRLARMRDRFPEPMDDDDPRRRPATDAPENPPQA